MDTAQLNGHKRAVHDTIPVEMPAIVDRATWEVAQMRGIANRHGSRNSQRFYSLTGMLYCGCGERIHGANERYVCASWSTRNRIGPRTCRKPSVKAELLEAFVWDHIFSLITDPGTLTERLRAARDGMASVIQPKLDEMKIVDDLMAELQTEAIDVARALVEAKGKSVVPPRPSGAWVRQGGNPAVRLA